MIINTWFLSHQWCFLWISTINQCWGHDIEGIPLSTNVHEDTCKRSHPFQRWFLDGNTSRFLEIATNHFLGNICPFSSIFLGVDTFLGTPFFGVRSLKMRSSCDQATKGHSFGHRAANFLANLRKKKNKHFPSDFWWCQVCLKMGCIPPGCGQFNRENDHWTNGGRTCVQSPPGVWVKTWDFYGLWSSIPSWESL